MASIPLCPSVEDLEINDVTRSLHVGLVDRDEYHKGEGSWSSDCENLAKPKMLSTCNAGSLKSIRIKDFQSFTGMRIWGDDNLESLTEIQELFQSSLSSLQLLELWECPKLRSISGGLEHLTALRELHLCRTSDLLNSFNEKEQVEDTIPWQSLAQSLRLLKLQDLPKLVNLPKGMQYLTSLQSLQIMDCKGLHSLTIWMSKLISLRHLEVVGSSALLKKRCENPTGEDWPSIQHIPHVLITESSSSNSGSSS